jgi:hypothetical protein
VFGYKKRTSQENFFPVLNHTGQENFFPVPNHTGQESFFPVPNRTDQENFLKLPKKSFFSKNFTFTCFFTMSLIRKSKKNVFF